MKHWIILVLCLICSLNSRSEREAIELNREAWQTLVQDVQFEENDAKKEKPPPPKRDNESFSLPDLSFIRPLLFTVIIIAIVVVLIVLLRNANRPGKVGKERVMAESIDEAEENLPEVALDNIFNKAVTGGDFKSALRVRFLMVLQELIDARLIQWKKRKTNEQYIAELHDPKIRSPFAHIVNVYDDTWYGNAALSAALFEEVNQTITAFNGKIHGHE